MKLIIMRIAAFLLLGLIIFLAVYEYINGRLMDNLPKIILAFVSVILCIVKTFVGKVSKADKSEMKIRIEKDAAPFYDDPKAKKYFEKGMRGLYGRNNDLARQYMKKAIAVANNPKAKGRAMYYIACCDYAEKKYGEAVKNLTEACKLDPNYPSGWSLLFSVYTDMGESELAKNSCEQGLLYCPNSLPLLSRLAKYYGDINNFEKAQEMFLRIYEAEPSNPISASNLSLAYARLKNFEKAYEYLEKAKALGYDGAEGLKNLIENEKNSIVSGFNFPEKFKLQTDEKEITGCSKRDLVNAIDSLLKGEIEFVTLIAPERGAKTRFIQSGFMEDVTEVELGMEEYGETYFLYAEIPNGKLLDCFLEFYESGNIPSIFKSYEVEN